VPALRHQHASDHNEAVERAGGQHLQAALPTAKGFLNISPAKSS
jgi:hypothetical protein